MRLLVFPFALLASVATRHALGQQQPATIPTELAAALLEANDDAYGSRMPTILVGRVPDSIPASLTSAPRATILGSVQSSRVVTIVLKSTMPPNQLLTAFDQQLMASGWAPPPSRADERGGFVSSYYSSGWGGFYCGDSGSVGVSYSPAPGGGTYLKVRYSGNKQLGICSPAPMHAFAERLLKLPILRSPPGMMQRGGGGGSGSNQVNTSARLIGPLGPADLLEHYLKQLAAAGWTMGSVATSGDVTIASATAKDAEGLQWNGALLAQRLASNELEVTIIMARPSER